MMKIRPAKKEDIKRIDEIYVDGSIREGKLQFPKVPVKKMQQDLDKYKTSRSRGFLREIKSKKQHWIVVEEDKEIIGFGQAWLKNKEIGLLEKICVDKNWTGQGIGLKIIRQLETWLKSKKIKFIESGIYFKNVPSIQLHKKAGYLPISLKMRKKVTKT